MVAGKRTAAAQGAWICFEDEDGHTLRPPKARSWSPRGRTPVVRVCGRGSGRISLAALICIKPGQRTRLFYRMRIHRPGKRRRRSFSETDYAAPLSAAHQQLNAPIMLVWDQLNTHVSVAMREALAARSDWLTVDTLPSYAPDLNPVEGVWAHLKSSVANLAACGIDPLASILKTRLKHLQ